MKQTRSFIKIVAFCIMLGFSAGAISGALFGVIWILASFLHESFNWMELVLGFVYGLGIGFFVGLGFGLLNGLAVAGVVKVSSARAISKSHFERIIGYTCILVSLVGALSIYPASVELIVIAPGYAAAIAVALGGIAWITSCLFCRRYWANPSAYRSAV